MTKIVAFVGRKQSGKDSCCLHILKNQTLLVPPNPYNDLMVCHLSFAASLKQICMDFFNLTHEQCYGTDEQKNTFTKVRWEDYLSINHILDMSKPYKFSSKTGLMTAREFMQEFGTGIMRKLYSNIWVDYLMKSIKNDYSNYDYALISDCRFVNEAKAVKDNGGVLVKVARPSLENKDAHQSEKESDSIECDYTIENCSTLEDMYEQLKAICTLIKKSN